MLKLLVQTQKNMLPVGIEIPRSMQGRLTRVLFINIYITNNLFLYCAVSSFLAFCGFCHLSCFSDKNFFRKIMIDFQQYSA